MVAAAPAARPDLSISSVAALTFASLLRRPLGTLLIGGVFVYLPMLLIAYVPDPGTDIFSLPFLYWWLQTTCIGAPAIIFGGWIALVIAGDADLRSPLTEVLRRIVPLALLSALVFVFGLLGTLLLIVPGIVWMLASIAATPALLAERLGPIAAAKRSIDLTRDRLAVIFVITLVLLGPIVILSVAIDYVLDPIVVVYGVGPVLDALLTMVGAALAAAVYRLLRPVDEPAAPPS